MGQNEVKIAHLTQSECFENFTQAIFIFLLHSIMLQSLKNILRVDPMIYVCIIFGPQLYQNFLFSPKEEFFGILHSSDFHLLLVPYIIQNLKKKKQLRVNSEI